MRQRVRHDVADAHAGRQGRVWVLQDDLGSPRSRRRGPRRRLAREADLAGRRRLEKEDRPRQRRLATAALSDESQRLALPDREADPLDGSHQRPGSRTGRHRREVLAEAVHAEQRRRSSGATASARTRRRGGRRPRERPTVDGGGFTDRQTSITCGQRPRTDIRRSGRPGREARQGWQPVAPPAPGPPAARTPAAPACTGGVPSETSSTGTDSTPCRRT